MQETDRCEEGPVVTELREIGSFRFFDRPTDVPVPRGELLDGEPVARCPHPVGGGGG